MTFNGNVYAFEPSSRERARLTRNLKINGCKNVQVFDLALGEEAVEGTLHVVEGTEVGCNSLRIPDVEQPTRPVTVRIRPLDGFLEEAKVTRIDFVKLDVEGAELSVLKGGTKYFRSKERPVILAEISDIRTKAWGYGAQEIAMWLEERGYRWFELKEDGAVRPAEPSAGFQDRNLVGVPPEKLGQVQTLVEQAKSTS